MRILQVSPYRITQCCSIIRHRCSSIASTSHDVLRTNSSPNFNTFVQSRSLYITGNRSIRARYTDDKNEQKGEKQEEKNEDESEKQGENEAKKIDPAIIKKLRMYVLVVAGLSFVTSFILLSQMFTGDRNLADGLTNEDFTRTGIPYNVFIQKYLNRGEVRRIIFVPANHRAIAILHPGAIIDGKPAHEQSIVVEYQQNAQQFWADIRKAEGELGIGLAEGVQIDLYQGMTGFKLIELAIGVIILGFLGTQYGRLLRKRLLENRAKQGKQQ